MNYVVTGTMNVPEFWEIDVDAKDEDEAIVEAMKWLAGEWPEAIDVEITETKVIN